MHPSCVISPASASAHKTSPRPPIKLNSLDLPTVVPQPTPSHSTNPRGLVHRASRVLHSVMGKSSSQSRPTIPEKSVPTPLSHSVFPLTPVSPPTAGDFSPFRLDDLRMSAVSPEYFTITLVESQITENPPPFSFTPLPTPPSESVIYPLPSRQRPVSVQTMPLPSRRRSVDVDISCQSYTYDQLGIMPDTEGGDALMSPDIDDWMESDTHLLQDYSPFPKTPDC